VRLNGEGVQRRGEWLRLNIKRDRLGGRAVLRRAQVMPPMPTTADAAIQIAFKNVPNAS